jgi:hypothetical protein
MPAATAVKRDDSHWPAIAEFKSASIILHMEEDSRQAVASAFSIVDRHARVSSLILAGSIALQRRTDVCDD